MKIRTKRKNKKINRLQLEIEKYKDIIKSMYIKETPHY